MNYIFIATTSVISQSRASSEHAYW